MREKYAIQNNLATWIVMKMAAGPFLVLLYCDQVSRHIEVDETDRPLGCNEMDFHYMSQLSVDTVWTFCPCVDKPKVSP